MNTVQEARAAGIAAQAAIGPLLAHDLAMHLIGAHCLPDAVHNSHAANKAIHDSEHALGEELHAQHSMAFDENKVELVLEHAEDVRDRLLAGDITGTPALEILRQGSTPILPRWHHLNVSGSARRSLVVVLSEGNSSSIRNWLVRYGIRADWTDVPPRLSFGGMLGLFCAPPGYRIALTTSSWAPGGYVAEAISEDEFSANWVTGHG